MSIKKVVKFETPDGTVFDMQEAADRHQLTGELTTAFAKSMENYGDDSFEAKGGNLEAVSDFLAQNRDKVEQWLKADKKLAAKIAKGTETAAE